MVSWPAQGQSVDCRYLADASLCSDERCNVAATADSRVAIVTARRSELIEQARDVSVSRMNRIAALILR